MGKSQSKIDDNNYDTLYNTESEKESVIKILNDKLSTVNINKVSYRLKEKKNNLDEEEYEEIDIKSNMCDKVVNDCMSKKNNNVVITKERIKLFINFFINLLIYISVVLICYYILTNNIPIQYKILKIIVFLIIFFFFKSIIFLFYIYKILLLSGTYDTTSNVGIIKYMLYGNFNKTDNKLTLIDFYNYIFSNKFRILDFPPKNFIKSLTVIDKEELIYKNSIFTDKDSGNMVLKYIVHVITVVLFIWDYPFQYYKDEEDDKYKNFKSVINELKKKGKI